MNADATNLDKLHDIIVPSPVPWWPPAPGWYWILGLAVVVASALSLRALIRWQHNCYRREALGILERQKAVLKNPTERAAALLVLSTLLKRTALTAFPREQVATLTGARWFEFLDRTGRGTAFSDDLGATLQGAVYDPQTASQLSEATLHELTTMIRRWIKTHTSNNGATAV